MGSIVKALREIQETPCCGKTVQVSLGLPIHDPQSEALQQIVHCPECGDMFKVTVLIMLTKPEKITPQRPKLVVVHG